MRPTEVVALVELAASTLPTAYDASLPTVRVTPSPDGPGWRSPAPLRWAPLLGRPPGELAGLLVSVVAKHPDVAAAEVMGDGMLEIVPTPTAAGRTVAAPVLVPTPRRTFSGPPPDLPRPGQRRPDHPVFLILWAHARALTAAKNAAAQGITAQPDVKDLLAEAAEIALLVALASYPQDLTAALDRDDSQRFLRRLADLARRTHAWLDTCPVAPVTVDEPVTEVHAARLALAHLTVATVSDGLNALKLPSPPRL